MSEIVIRAESLSKSYWVGHRSAQRESYTALRDVIARETKTFGRKTLDFVRGRQIVQGDEIEEFWALEDINFEVKRGEVLGIIGRNGAGKSTLLKILSRITEPTRGRVTLRGRVASLLEVGTGFHPELTGRENIFLNGAILGMTRAEIKAKFDEIVAFAEVERFLDTPVKRYSSGMYVRLAFSIAAYLEPEILIVDEVLAVGDVEFQKKCIGKMHDVALNQGRTILFVSHSMAAVESMCGSALLLAGGRCVMQGATSPVVHEYLRDITRVSMIPLKARIDRTGSGEVQFESVALEGADGTSVIAFRCGAEAIIRLTVANCLRRDANRVRIAIGIENEVGQRVTHLDTALSRADLEYLVPGLSTVRVVIPKMALFPGRYRMTLFCSVNEVTSDWVRDASTFDVEAADYYGTGQLPLPNQGLFLSEHRFLMKGGASPDRIAISSK